MHYSSIINVKKLNTGGTVISPAYKKALLGALFHTQHAQLTHSLALASRIPYTAVRSSWAWLSSQAR